ncbi:MAG: LTA synthase family protein [Clostridia bacterium]|nr:LTA synthase family protein [Clostridia bacterium]
MIFSNFIPFIFELLIFLGFSLILYSLLNKIWLSILIIEMTYLIITLISSFKENINGTPLLLKDIEFAKNLSELAGFSSGKLTISLITAVIIILVIASLFLLFLWSKSKEKLSVKTRISLLLTGVTITLFFFNPLTYRLNYKISRNYSEEEKISNYSVVNGLYFTLSSNIATNYNPTKKEIENLKKEVAYATDNYTFNNKEIITPNVIFIMSEAFFDITELPDVSYSEDPCPNFHELSKISTSGKFVSTTFSGGTGYVEAEVLTGLCGKNLKGSSNLTALSNDVYNKMPVITDVFKNYGYETTFLHSYNSNLYNRLNMYKGFGFDNIFFDDTFPSDVTKHNELISDSDLTKKIISLIESKSDKPMFMYAVSMENHYPYINGKYAPNERIDVKSKKLSENELEIMNALADGINGADTALGELVDYLKNEDEPYMVVFFGDHLPNLSTTDGKSVYTTLGVSSSTATSTWQPEELFKMLQTDYLIWTNYEEDGNYPDKTEGCTFLGLSVLKRLGFNLTDYYIYLDSVIAKSTLIYRDRLFVDQNKKCYKTIPENKIELMNNYKTAVRDIIYSDNEVFKINR